VDPSRGRGRPRDARINGRALEATRALLVERGFEATTVQAVARRSGLHASALYRRWPSRIELIEEATFPGLSPLRVQPTGDLRRDLRRFMLAYLETFSAPAARVAAAGLLAHHQAGSPGDSDLYARVSARPQFKAILQAADPGLVDPELDPDDVFDMVLGAVLTRILLAEVSLPHQPVDRSVEMVIRLLRPS
jgi:AcrR family transcriptional regulator